MALDLPSLPKKTICKNSKIKGQKSSNTKKNSMYKKSKNLSIFNWQKLNIQMFEYPQKIAQIS
jgi:hypothetical protein